MSARRPKLGFLGLGWIGLHRMQALAGSGAAEVAALCDPDPAAIERARRIAPQAAVVGDGSALFERALDGVVIATPSALHAEQAALALARGLAVFCQKPLGRTALETSRVLESARAADRLLGVDLSYRFTTAMTRIHELARGGELGEVFAVHAAFHNAYGPDKPWFYDRALSGGGALVDLGTHVLDLALWVLGYPAIEGVAGRLFSRGVPLDGRNSAVEDYVTAELDLAGGAVLQLGCSWKLHAGRDCVIDVAFYGTRGGARFRNVAGSFYDFSAELMAGTSRRTIAAPPDEWGGRAAIAWAQRLAADRRFDPNAMHLLDLSVALDAIYERGRRRPGS